MIDILAPSFEGYIFCFVLINIIILGSYIKRRYRAFDAFIWFLIFVFCLFPFWNSDYFTYKNLFGTLDTEFRDPLYYYIQNISFGSYTLFRSYIWGCALLLFFATIKRLNLSDRNVLFIFAIIFLLTFSYARASLAMATYFFGISFLFKPIRFKYLGYLVGFTFILFSYYGHRSMLPLIILTPLSFFKFTKTRFVLTILLIPVFTLIAGHLLQSFSEEEIVLEGSLGNFSTAGNRYAEFKNKQYNTRAQIMNFIHYAGFYIVYLFCMWKIYLSINRFMIDKCMKRYMTVTTFIILIATSFFLTSSEGANFHIAYRYLFMSGIPCSIGMAYLMDKKIVSQKIANRVIFLSFAYTEMILLGNIIMKGHLLE